MSRAAAVSNERLRSKNELRASRTAGWELERKRFERLPFSILEPSRPALCETIAAVDGPRRVRFKRDLRGLATVRAHRVIHLTRATVVAAASSAASVFVHSLPTIRTLVGTDGRLTGPILIKGAHPARTPEIDGNGVLESNGGFRGPRWRHAVRQAAGGGRFRRPHSRHRRRRPTAAPCPRIDGDP